MTNEKDYINKMYDASLENQKAEIQEDYDQAGVSSRRRHRNRPMPT